MIRAITSQDIPALKTIIEANDLFPAEMLDEMTSEYLANPDSHEIWLTDEDSSLVTLAYCAPERMTEGTWNLYLIAVHPDHQGTGHGSAMMKYLETLLAKRGARILLVETSGLPSYEQTQQFYRNCGYHEEARIREFYQAGEDKIVFRKALIAS